MPAVYNAPAYMVIGIFVYYQAVLFPKFITYAKEDNANFRAKVQDAILFLQI